MTKLITTNKKIILLIIEFSGFNELNKLNYEYFVLILIQQNVIIFKY